MFLLNGELQGMGHLPQSLQGGYWLRRKWGERPSRPSCDDGRCLGDQKLAQGQFLAASEEISNEQGLSSMAYPKFFMNEPRRLLFLSPYHRCLTTQFRK